MTTYVPPAPVSMTALRQHLSTAAANLRQLATLAQSVDAPQSVVDELRDAAGLAGGAYRDIALLCEAYISKEARQAAEHPRQHVPEHPRPHGSRA